MNASEDNDLSEYLSGDTKVSRRYRAIEADEIPAELDRFVHAQSRADIASTSLTIANVTSLPARSSRLLLWRRIGTPVALAASVVLVVSILLDKDVKDGLVPVPNVEPLSASSTPPIDLPVETSESKAVDVVTPESTAKPVAVTRRQRTNVPSAAPPLRAKAVEPAVLNEVVVTGFVIQSRVEDSPLPVEVFSSDEPPTSSANRSRTNARRSHEATGLEEVMVTAQKRSATPNAGGGPRGTIPPASFSPREPTEAELEKQYREANPMEWLIFIRELRASGNSRKANREWRRFVKAHPTYPVADTDAARPK